MVGGSPSSGASRISIKDTRTIIDSILNKSINKSNFNKDDVFGLLIPNKLDGIEDHILNPINAWKSKEEFHLESKKLSDLFKQNFTKYGNEVEHLKVGGPF